MLPVHDIGHTVEYRLSKLDGVSTGVIVEKPCGTEFIVRTKAAVGTNVTNVHIYVDDILRNLSHLELDREIQEMVDV